MNQSGQQIQEIALRIREMRNIMGYSAEEMALRTQVSESTYVEYENGATGVFITTPSIRTESAICWYSWINPTIFTSGPVTRPASIWNAINAPMEIL